MASASVVSESPSSNSLTAPFRPDEEIIDHHHPRRESVGMMEASRTRSSHLMGPPQGSWFEDTEVGQSRSKDDSSCSSEEESDGNEDEGGTDERLQFQALPMTASRRALVAIGESCIPLDSADIGEDGSTLGKEFIISSFEEGRKHLYPVRPGEVNPNRTRQCSSSSTSFDPTSCPLYPPLLQQHELSKLVGSPLPAPSWKEMSSEILPAAARELLLSSLHRLYHRARLTYSQTKWVEQYSEYGNNAAGYFQQPNFGSNAADEVEESQNELACRHCPVDIDELPKFSSLPWIDRQMVQEWRTYSPNQFESEIDEVDELAKNSKDAEDDEEVDDEDVEFDHARTLVPAPLARPTWSKADVCYVCHKTFGPALLRHHCRLCGRSVCHGDSRHTRKLPHLGYHPDVPERVCDACAYAIWEQNLAERIAWRLARCRDYQNGALTPYFEIGFDSVEQKAYRIAEAAITMAKSIPLGAQATVAVETADVLRKYGLNGIYTIMLRKEFMAAADLLRKALGINQTAWPLSVHELSAAIFYALAQHRAMRGINPDREHLIHAVNDVNRQEASSDESEIHRNRPQSDREQQSAAITEPVVACEVAAGPACALDVASSGDDSGVETNGHTQFTSTLRPVCDHLPDSDVASLIFYAPIALNFIYMEKEVDMQLLAAQQGWRLVYAYLNSERDGASVGVISGPGTGQSHHVHDRPASALFVHDEQKIACVAIRGTSTIHDVITDIRHVPVPFPDSATGVLRAESEGEEEWTDVQFRGQCVAVAGMASAAFNLYREHVDSLIYFARRGYRIRLTGHSLGGAVATLLGLLVLRDLKAAGASVLSDDLGDATDSSDNELKAPLFVYAYGSPCCVDDSLADVVESFVVTAVLHDDVVPRLSPTACRGLLKHLLHIRETWVKTQFPDDMKAFADRAKTVWAPRWRGGFTLTSATTSSIRFKRYCRKQIQNGKEKILLVKKKFSSTSTNKTRPRRHSVSTYSTTYRTFENGRRSLFDEHSIGVAQKNTGSLDQDENDIENQETLKPRLVMDYMGALDSKTGCDGMVVDGDEFFDPDALLAGSSDEDSFTSSEEAFDDTKMAQSAHIGPLGDTARFDVEADVDMYASLGTDTSSRPVDHECDEDSPDAVVLEELPLPRMFVPGKIVHVYAHRGVYKASYVPRDFRELRRISMAGNMLSDHKTKSYFDALQEVRAVRRAPESPPCWTSFDEDDTCSCCASRFTWASTSDSEAQEARDKHNCRSCGALVCHPCSENRAPLPSIGLTVAARICDRCYYNDIDGISSGPSTDGVGNEKFAEDSSPDTNEYDLQEKKPVRYRAKRSAVVDDLASRVHASPFQL